MTEVASQPAKISQPEKVTIALFPYLYVKNGLDLDRLAIKTAKPSFVDSESPIVRQALKQLQRFFFVDNKTPISDYSYVLLTVGDAQDTDLQHSINTLDNFVTALRFDRLSYSDLNTYFSHFNFFIFRITVEQLLNKDKLNRYYASINGLGYHCFFIENDKVLNPLMPFNRHHPITLRDLEQTEFFKTYYLYLSMFLTPEERGRFLRAMEWYNRSFADAPGLDECEAIANMETAFEALFKTSGEKYGVKAQVKSGICHVLGDTRIIKHWFEKFWGLRNSIVHGDITMPSFLYTSPGAQRGHMSHLYAARKIFKECFDGLLRLRQLSHPQQIQKELISNEVRMNEAADLLRKTEFDLSRAYANGALAKISEIRKYDVSPGLKESVDFGKLFLPLVISWLDETDTTQKDLVEIMQNIINYDKKELAGLDELYWQAYEISPWHFINLGEEKDDALIALGYALESFMEYMYYRWLHFKTDQG